jgi:AcrR family transcriptional regulator
VPRISAPTVAEHRAKQQAALLDAARRLLVRVGIDGVTFAAVAREAHLARNSVYEYFADRSELLGALIEADFPAWHDAIAAAMDAARSPQARVLAYVRTQLDLVAAGRHEIGPLLAGGKLPDELRQRSRALHRGLVQHLIAALEELELVDAERTAYLLQGVVDAATTRIEHGDDSQAVVAEAERFVRGALPKRRRTA